jgi:hypothetical protein
MTSHRARRCTGVLASTLALGLLGPAAASAQSIRVLLIRPTEPGRLAQQVGRLEGVKLVVIDRVSGDVAHAAELPDRSI